MTTEQLLALDADEILQMQKENPKQLRQITSRLRSTAVSRLKRLERYSIVAPSVSKARREGFPTIAGRPIQTVRKQFRQLQSFLKSSASTVAGAKKFEQEFKERFGGDRQAEDWGDSEKIGIMFRTLNRLREKYPDMFLGKIKISGQVIEWIYDEMSNDTTSIDELVEIVSEKIEEQYEKGESWADDIYEGREEDKFWL